MKILVFLLALLTFSCARQSVMDSTQKKTLAEDIQWMKELFPSFQNPVLENIFSEVKSIELANGDCDPGQIACTKFIFPNTIFVSPAFFKLRTSMRLSTLLHEAAHHYYHYYHHTDCGGGDYTCDDKMESAYGAEILFYRELIRLYPQNENYKTELNLVEKSVRIP